RSGRVDLELRATLPQSLISHVDRKYAAARIEIRDIARLEALPAPVPHTLGKHRVEDQTASRRQYEPTLRRPQRVHACGDPQQVSPLVPEPLASEIVRYPSPPEQLEPLGQLLLGDSRLANADDETVGRKRAARKFARVSECLEHLELCGSHAQPRIGGLCGLRHGEPLDRHRAPILEARIADLLWTAPTDPGELASNPLCVRIALAHLQQDMLTAA